MRHKILWKRVLLFVMFTIVLLTSLAGAAVYAFVSKIQTPHHSIPVAQHAADKTNVPADKFNQPITILLIGLDDGDPDNPDSPRRSDTMITASIDSKNKTVNLLSIPRDSRVMIPGRNGYDKIAHAYSYGGPDLAVRTVTDFLHIPIDYYIAIEWQSFIKVVDILGGVNLNVEHDMNYDDPYDNLSIHIPKGRQHLDGKRAGEYVRYRHDELGDIGRVERQQIFLKALSSQMLQSGTILKLPALMTTISNYVRTDMNILALAKVGNMIRDMNSDSLHTEMIPGDFATIDDISYWAPDMKKTQDLIKNMFSGQVAGQQIPHQSVY
ncbi:MAG: LCP family protein [Sporomusaceae bacterium]|nr:LCP family protein [Sporomusaceae bacterium]